MGTKQVIILIGVIISLFIGLGIGSVKISPISIIKILIGNNDENLTAFRSIILYVRLPRVILGLIVGAVLSSVGGTLQGILRNPLADPYLLGVSTGGALGGTLSIIITKYLHSFRIGFIEYLPLPIFSFLGALITIFIVYRIAQKNGTVSSERLILSGVIVNAFFSAIIMFIMSISQKDMQRILYILMGNLGYISSLNIWITLLIIGLIGFIGIIIISTFGMELNILSLGEESAIQTGVDVGRLKKILFIVTSLLTGAVVSVSGLIGFVGLIIPHTIRLLISSDYRVLIPSSALVGAGFLVISDTIARSILSTELPVGVITAFFGSPLFIYLLIKR